MRFSRHKAIRELLIDNDDGLTIRQISEQLGVDHRSVRKSIQNAYGIYIDRWTQCKGSPLTAVYMCVHVPANTPKPD